MFKTLISYKSSFLKIHKKSFSSDSPSTVKDFHWLIRSESIKIDNELKLALVKNGKHQKVLYSFNQFSRFYKFLAGMVLGTLLAGGYTRITNSGLSMVRWDPFQILPPISEHEWIKEFEEYKKFPQFQKDFPEMSLSTFKEIYRWEFIHR